MKYLRTPDDQFENLPGYSFAPHYEHLIDDDGDQFRIHYVDEGPRDAHPILLLHGEPSWSYLYRKMIPTLAEAGHRVMAPDLVGFGKSDKPVSRDEHTYKRHVDWMSEFMEKLDLTNITLFCQDWGGMIGLRLVAEHPERFDRVVAANTGLPTGDQAFPEAFMKWREFSQKVPEFIVGKTINRGCVSDLPDDVIAAYDAPFPDESYKEGPRIMPVLVPISDDNPETPANRQAWNVLSEWKKPFLTTFSDSDPITAGVDSFFQSIIPGAKGQKHVTIEAGGHFLQEDKGEEIAGVIVEFIKDNPTT